MSDVVAAAGVHPNNRALWYAWLEKVTGGVGRRGSNRNTSMDAIGVYRGDPQCSLWPTRLKKD